MFDLLYLGRRSLSIRDDAKHSWNHLMIIILKKAFKKSSNPF